MRGASGASRISAKVEILRNRGDARPDRSRNVTAQPSRHPSTPATQSGDGFPARPGSCSGLPAGGRSVTASSSSHGFPWLCLQTASSAAAADAMARFGAEPPAIAATVSPAKRSPVPFGIAGIRSPVQDSALVRSIARVSIRPACEAADVTMTVSGPRLRAAVSTSASCARIELVSQLNSKRFGVITDARGTSRDRIASATASSTNNPLAASPITGSTRIGRSGFRARRFSRCRATAAT